MSDKLTSSLQESILTLIATNDKEGRIATGLLRPDMFDEDYKEIADRILKFRKKHKSAPGQNHIDDIVDDVLDNTKHKKHRTYMRIMEGILAQAESLNADYVLSRVNEFSRRQGLKEAILKAADVYQTGKEGLVDEVEGILYKALKPKQNDLDSGTFLSQKGKVLNFLDRLQADYKTGIKQLDARAFGPTYGTMMVLMGAKGTGKSWWCTNLGTSCWRQGAKVVHITLEMSEEKVVGRYIQNLWALGKRGDQFKITNLELDKLERVVGIKQGRRTPRLSLDNGNVRRYIRKKQKRWGAKLGRVVIKEFPTKSLSVAKLDAYLDMMELRNNFIPNVLIIDYPDLMWMEKNKDPRMSISNTYQELRGLFQRRNLAGICPTQTNRKGWDASVVKGSMVGEDASKFMTADMVATYSRTPAEKKIGLARIFVEKNRDDEDGFTIVISQNYNTGQFCLSSARMSSSYMDLVKPFAEEEEESDDE